MVIVTAQIEKEEIERVQYMYPETDSVAGATTTMIVCLYLSILNTITI